MTPSVSIVTPTLNAERYLAECLASVGAQGVADVEHIVVDGGSADRTREIVESFAGVRWVDDPGGSQTHAINRGFALAQGDVLAWLNADDLYAGDSLRAVVAYFADRVDVDVLYGDCDVIDSDGHLLWRERPGPFDHSRLLRAGNYISQPAVFLRRRAMDRAGPLDPALEFGMDYELWLRLRDANVAYVPRVLASFRWHPNSRSAQNALGAWREIPSIVRRHGGGWTPQLAWSFGRCLITMGRRRATGEFLPRTRHPI